jgi:hypothetical protein
MHLFFPSFSSPIFAPSELNFTESPDGMWVPDRHGGELGFLILF